MAENKQIVLPIVQGPNGEKYAIGKMPMVLTYARLAEYQREIYPLGQSETPQDIPPEDYTMNMDQPRCIMAVDESEGSNEGVEIVLTGKDAKGKQISETITIEEGVAITKNAFLYLTNIHADEVPADSITIQLSSIFGFALDLSYNEFYALGQSNGNTAEPEIILPDAVYGEGDDPVFTVDDEYDTISINDSTILEQPGTHLTFYFK